MPHAHPNQGRIGTAIDGQMTGSRVQFGDPRHARSSEIARTFGDERTVRLVTEHSQQVKTVCCPGDSAKVLEIPPLVLHAQTGDLTDKPPVAFVDLDPPGPPVHDQDATGGIDREVSQIPEMFVIVA